VGRHDDSGGPCPLGATGDGTEIPWVGNPVETDEERARLPGELERVAVAVRLDTGDDALVVTSPGRVRQLALRLDVNTGPAIVAKPFLGGNGPLRGPELEYFPRAAQRFTNGAPAVDLLRGHRFGRS
jgi:hypothetical protein